MIYNLPNVKGVSVYHVFESQDTGMAPYLIAEFAFDSREIMDAALASQAGQRLYADVPELMRYLEHEPRILFSELHAS